MTNNERTTAIFEFMKDVVDEYERLNTSGVDSPVLFINILTAKLKALPVDD